MKELKLRSLKLKETCSKIIVLLVLTGLYISCEPHSNYTSKIESIKEIYNAAQMQAGYNLDSAIMLLDSGIQCSVAIKYDSLIVLGMLYKAVDKEQQGDRNYADSVHNMLLYSNKYKIDSLLLNKIKMSYVKLNSDYGNYEKALNLCEEAISFYERKNIAQAVMGGNMLLSQIYSKQNNFNKAMDASIKALKLAEQLDHKTGIALIYSTIGEMYFREQEFDRSLECFKKALDHYTTINDVMSIAVSCQRIGTVLIENKDYKEAKEYLERSGRIFSEAGIISNYMNVLNSLGVMCKEQGDQDKALEYYNKVLEINKTVNNHQITAEVYSNIGAIYHSQKKYDKTEYYYEKAHKALIMLGETDFRYYYENMMLLNEEKKNWEEAYFWARKFESHSDSIFNIEKFKETENLRTIYETEKKELQLEKMNIEKEKDKATISKNRITIISIATLLLLTVIFSFIFIRQNHLKLQSYRDLVKKNEELIIVNTAKRQQALVGNKTEQTEKDKTSFDKAIISDELIQTIKQKLYELINAKFYTNVDLSLSEAAEMLGTNTRYLSQIINDTFKCNFPSFINQLRVEEAQRLLKDKKYHNLKVEVIGQKAGFKSKSVFYKTFKSDTGLTPSVYQDQIKPSDG